MSILYLNSFNIALDAGVSLVRATWTDCQREETLSTARQNGASTVEPASGTATPVLLFTFG